MTGQGSARLVDHPVENQGGLEPPRTGSVQRLRADDGRSQQLWTIGGQGVV
jgi:hypothetical protein